MTFDHLKDRNIAIYKEILKEAKSHLRFQTYTLRKQDVRGIKRGPIQEI